VLSAPHEVLTSQEWHQLGRERRKAVPRSSHAEWTPPSGRPDPVGILEEQAEERVPDLIGIRHGRMAASPFAYFRGAAAPMAWDLGHLPATDIRVQCCGDAHLLNFGMFGAEDRRLVFDVNDFDETLPGPFEWDVKRLAASLEIAGRENGFKRKPRRAVVLAAAAGYRHAMREFARQPNLAVWYAHLNLDRELDNIRPLLEPARAKRTAARLAKVRTRDSLQAFDKLTTVVDSVPRIISDPPLIVPITELLNDMDAGALFSQLRSLLSSYRRTLPSDRKHLLDQYRLVDMARKVVGVGSVGTRAWIALMEGVDGSDPMFLQIKEAQTSVLEEFAGFSGYANHGQRVVVGQHLMQATSDIFLGWQRAVGVDDVPRDYYVRQLRDWKYSVVPEEMIPSGMAVYAGMCGWTLARAHARSGDRVAIAAYLGGKDTFDEAIVEFACAYADQNDRDYAALEAAAASGRLEVRAGL
jgi:uncharacterized protein (DUF2252 family)